MENQKQKEGDKNIVKRNNPLFPFDQTCASAE